MQNQILGFFIITCVCLGVLCGVQWRQLREKRTETIQLQDDLADRALELDGKTTALDTLKREQHRLTEQWKASTAEVHTLEIATNSLIRQLDRTRREAIDLNGQEIGPLGTLLTALLRDPVLADRLLVAELRAQLEGTPNPLDAAQSTELLDLLAAERKHQPAKNTNTTAHVNPSIAPDTTEAPKATPSGWLLDGDAFQKQLQEQETLNRRVLAVARDLLLPEQLDALARSQTNVAQLQKYSFEWGQTRLNPEVPETPETEGGESQ